MEGNGNPLQCSCLENPRDEGAWWAAVYGVAQSRTRTEGRPQRTQGEDGHPQAKEKGREQTLPPWPPTAPANTLTSPRPSSLQNCEGKEISIVQSPCVRSFVTAAGRH